MKGFLMMAAALLLLLSGCRMDNQNIIVSETPKPDATATAEILVATEKTPAPGTSLEPKLSGDITDAPTKERIAEVEGYALSTVLTYDSLEYELPLDQYFAVALKEDVTKGNRWLLSSDDVNFELVRETHIDGYRTFIMKPIQKSDTYIVFELASAEGVSIEILTYHVTLG